LQKQLLEINHRHIKTNSDSEVLTNIFAAELEQITQNIQLENEHIFQAVSNIYKNVKGAYSVTSLIVNYGLIAFRDPYGIRPLVLGKKTVDGKATYFVASESCAIDIYECDWIRDIKPAEVVIIKLNGEVESRCIGQSTLNVCLFEFVYLARPDSIIENTSVQLARQKMGEYLANAIKKIELDCDVVIGVPDTSRIIAIEVAKSLGKPYREGFVKNHFSGRTFMLSKHEERIVAVRSKLSPIALEFKNKSILLIDDSIVRGTTSKQIINIVRKCGAKKVFIASAAPEVRFPNIYGIDIPTYTELIAHQRTQQEICQIIGADQIIFQTLDDLKSAITTINPAITNFEASCFDGKYITEL
jgi:amidophosphoribosyltransferase